MKQILALVPDLVNLFAQVAASPVETSEVKAQVGRAFSHLISLYGHQMQPLLSNLSPVHANALAAFAPKSWYLIEPVYCSSSPLLCGHVYSYWVSFQREWFVSLTLQMGTVEKWMAIVPTQVCVWFMLSWAILPERHDMESIWLTRYVHKTISWVGPQSQTYSF